MNELPIPPMVPWEQALEWFRAQSTDTLKRMWDDPRDDWHVWCYEIHRVMNERGEGHYVAV